MEVWEALDVDDSDLPSLLRPCKQRRLHQTTATSHSHPNHLTPSSPPFESHLSQTLAPRSVSHQQFQSPPSIPGPAAAVQSAMLRRIHDRQDLSTLEPPIPTQEYIQRAIVNAEEDDDFKRNPWLSAVEFLTADGMEDGVIASKPLGSIMKCLKKGKADQVVAVIKSSTPNGLGDLMVTLKDPTGTVSGSIHRKVLAESEFAKDISVGSVLILRKVAVFAPSRSARYLNVTLSNVVKVFHKDCGPPMQQKNYPGCGVKYATPGTVSHEESRMSQKELHLEHGRTKERVNEIRESCNSRGNLHDNNHQEDGNLFQGSVVVRSNSSSINMTQNAAVRKEPLPVSQSCGKKYLDEAVGIKIPEDECKLSRNNGKMPGRSNMSGSLKHTSLAPNIVGNCSEKEIPRVDAVQQQRDPLITTVALPQWTDEQLHELFAGDFEDDGCFDI